MSHQRGLEVADRLRGADGWFATCECGWIGMFRLTQEEAQQTHAEHVRTARWPPPPAATGRTGT